MSHMYFTYECTCAHELYYLVHTNGTYFTFPYMSCTVPYVTYCMNVICHVCHVCHVHMNVLRTT